jgi:23S rRNA (adenine2503-C2)-methyltransferase
MAVRTALYELTRAELTRLLGSWGFGAHAARLWRHLYWECADSIGAMTALPAKVRTRLEAEASLEALPLAGETHSEDGFTRKYLLALGDGGAVETVLMRFTGRVTACVSSQAGCAMGCVFCATGQMGFRRHLSAAEIIAQCVHVNRVLGSAGRHPEAGGQAPRLRNVVLMGMGEPLHNYEAVMKAVGILLDPSGFSLSSERITLSTVGVVPGILRLAEERRPVHLAVSLHAATQEGRAALLPVARTWPLDQLMAACRIYSERTGRRIFYEWTLIEGRNDSPEDARAVGRLLRGLPAQVNLIPLNPTAGYGGLPGRIESARRFQRILAEEFSLPTTLRQRRGIDIAAGCGQLAVGPPFRAASPLPAPRRI